MAKLDLKYCTIQVQDGGANFIEVKIGEGNLTYSERRNMEYALDKGLIDTVREGDEIPLELRMDFQWERLSGNGTTNLEDAFKNIGEASDWATTSADACEPYAVDVVLNYNPDCSDPVIDDTITFPDFRWETLEHDSRGGQISVTGQCNAKTAVLSGTLGS